MVILIMIDGTRPDALDTARCPTLRGLMQRGASTMQAHSVMPSITLPCHMSIFHSVPPTRHGITARPNRRHVIGNESPNRHGNRGLCRVLRSQTDR